MIQTLIEFYREMWWAFKHQDISPVPPAFPVIIIFGTALVGGTLFILLWQLFVHLLFSL